MKAMTPLALALLIASGPAAAASGNVDVYGIFNVATAVPNQYFPLWHNSIADRNGVADSLLSFGSLLVGTKEDCDYSPPDESGNVTVTVTQKIKLVDSYAVPVGAITHKFTSEPVQPPSSPDPASTPVCSLNSGTPIMGNMGPAHANGSYYIVIGSAFISTTGSANENSYTVRDNSSYTFAVYNLDGSLKWRKRLTGLRGDWSFDPIVTPNPVNPYQGMIGLLHKSAVGDFLDADGNAEIRVARIKKTATGLLYTYTYYDLETGSVLKNVSLTVK